MLAEADRGEVFGWELVSLQEPDRIKHEVAYRESVRVRQADFVRALIDRGDSTITYDLRIVSEPKPPAPARIRVAVLARTPKQSAVTSDSLGELMVSTFPEGRFAPLGGSMLESFLAPFDVDGCVQVERRRGTEELGTLRRGSRSMGFHGKVGVPRSTSASIHHVFPFSASGVDHGRLFRMLLVHPHRVMVSVRLRPTRLHEDEEEVLEAGIRTCDDYARGLDRAQADLRQALMEQTRGYQDIQTRMLESLSDDCTEMTIDVAGAGPLPHHVVDAVGALVTAPAGGIAREVHQSLHAYLQGGYEVVDGDGETGCASRVLDLVDPGGEEPYSRLYRLFDSVEAAQAFRFPDALVPEPTGLERTAWTIPIPPRELPGRGTLLATVDGREFRISPGDRLRHVYVIGQTGTGKTTLLQTMILDDIEADKGVCVVDPHGDLYRWILDRIPEKRWHDVVLVDPSDSEFPVGFNPIEHRSEWERHHLVQEMVGMIRTMVLDEYSNEVAGPIFFQDVRMNLLLVMSDSSRGATLVDFYNVYQQPEPERRWSPPADADPLLRNWATEVLPRLDYRRWGSDGSMGGYVSSKFQPFVFDPLLRNILGQRRSTFDLRECMDESRIVLVNLAKGLVTEPNARWFGMLFLAKLLTEAMGRIEKEPADRDPFHLYVDEFQSLATETFVSMLSEGRKFGLSAVMANQFVSQIDNPKIPAGVFGNTGTLVGFRVGVDDAEMLARQFAPEIEVGDFLALPNWKAYVSGLIEGVKRNPFQIDTVPPEAPVVSGAREHVVEHSRENFASAKAAAEADVEASMSRELP